MASDSTYVSGFTTLPFDVNLVVQVRPGRQARASYRRDALAARDALAVLHIDARTVCITSDHAVAVIDLKRVAVPVFVADPHHHAGRRRDDGRAHRRRHVDALVRSRNVQERMPRLRENWLVSQPGVGMIDGTLREPLCVASSESVTAAKRADNWSARSMSVSTSARVMPVLRCRPASHRPSRRPARPNPWQATRRANESALPAS